MHRDIKPGNLMVRPDGVVKLTDFGIAQARDAAPLTRTGMVVGTAQYLSPEQAQGMEVTAASDVYSLGVVGYECLCGARPFDGASQVAIALAHINRPPPPLPAHVPPAVRLLVERALAKDPADRFPDGGAFAEAIRRVAAGRHRIAPVLGPGTTADPGRRRRAATTRAPRSSPSPVPPPSPARGHAGPPTGPAGPMPPLQATAGGRRRLGRRDRTSRTRRATLAVAGGRAGAGAAARRWHLLAARTTATAAATTRPDTNPTVTSASSTGFVIDPAAYIGEPADAVEAELLAQGLVVDRETADDDQLAAAGIALDAGDVAGWRRPGRCPPERRSRCTWPTRRTRRTTPSPPTSSRPTTTPATTSAAPTTSSSSSTSSSSTSSTTTTDARRPRPTALPAGTAAPATAGADCDGDGLPDRGARPPTAGAAGEEGTG